MSTIFLRGRYCLKTSNQRSSIFRLIVGTALAGRERLECSTWDLGNSAGRDIRALEFQLEQAVSEVIRSVPFLHVAIEDEAGPNSLRGRVERNSIALLSNFEKSPLDPPSSRWLGNHCDRERVKASGLWNQNHVDESYDPVFLDELEALVAQMGRK